MSLIESRTAFFGDSITTGSGATDSAHRFSSLIIANKSSLGWVELNCGLSGQSLQNTVQNTVNVIGGAVQNNARDSYTTQLLAFYPQRVFILYGVNDLRLNDAAFTASNFENDLSEIVDAIIAAGVLPTNIIIGSPPYLPAATYEANAPYDGGSLEKHAAYIAACAAVAMAKGIKYVDVYQYMADNGGDTLIADGIHPNDAGHAAIAAAFLSVL